MRSIDDIIAEVLRERGFDRRTCYTHVTAPPDAGAVAEVECSDAGAGAELSRRLALDTGEARARVRILPGPGLPALMLVTSGVADVRREPAHASELVSEMIYGDAVVPLKATGDWTLVRADDGYIGWIRDWHLRPWSHSEMDAFLARATHRVRSNHAAVLSAPELRATPVAQLVTGVSLVVGEGARAGWRAVMLADGKAGFVRSADTEKIPHPGPTPSRLARTGFRFLGVPYRWGGTTPNGFDCSGLIQRIFRLNGVILPRDSDMQARFGRERSVRRPEELRPGDLVFFGRDAGTITHVGLILPGGGFLHSYGQVIVNSLDPASDRYRERLASIWQTTRNPLGSQRG